MIECIKSLAISDYSPMFSFWRSTPTTSTIVKEKCISRGQSLTSGNFVLQDWIDLKSSFGTNMIKKERKQDWEVIEPASKLRLKENLLC